MKRRQFLGTCLGGLAGIPSLSSAARHTGSPVLIYSREKTESEVLVKVLGTAQDGGLPQIGCYCPNCLQARKDTSCARLISSLAVLDLKTKKSFIIDLTPDLRVQYDIIHDRLGKEKSGRKNVPDGILLTHAHIGHYTGLMFYGYESQSTTELPVYCSERMGRFLSQNGPWSQMVSLKNISLQVLHLDQTRALTENISVVPFQVPHRDEYSDTLGFLIRGRSKSLLYIPDIQSWEAWDRSIVDEVEKSDIALLDGTFFGPEELPGRDLTRIGHPFITTSLKTLGESVRTGRKRVYFTHLNHTNLALDHEGQPRQTVREAGFDLAADGMEFFL